MSACRIWHFVLIFIGSSLTTVECQTYESSAFWNGKYGGQPGWVTYATSPEWNGMYEWAGNSNMRGYDRLESQYPTSCPCTNDCNDEFLDCASFSGTTL